MPPSWESPRRAIPPVGDGVQDANWHTILKIIGIILTLGIGFYLKLRLSQHLAGAVRAYFPCRGAGAELSGAGAATAAAAAGRALADRIGAKAVLLLSTMASRFFPGRFYVLISHGSVAAIIGGQAVLALLQAGIPAAVPAFMVEALPKHVRCTALSFGQKLRHAIFGGTCRWWRWRWPARRTIRWRRRCISRQRAWCRSSWC